MSRRCLFVPGVLPGLNEYSDAERRNRYQGARIKREWTETVAWLAREMEPLAGPVHVRCRWIAPNRRRDPDNVAAAIKYVLDGLVAGGLLPGDGWRYIRSISHTFEVDGEAPGVEIILQEDEEAAA